MYEYQFDHKGFEWVALDHRYEGVMAYKGKDAIGPMTYWW